ncbi:MAG: hypothetical protein RJA63_2266 [Pseudomonadota bacterium]
MQPFQYSDLAHLIIPAQFYWERVIDSEFQSGTKQQDIDQLSKELTQYGLPHRKTNLVLEIKLY